MIDVVYVLGKGSDWDNNEIRFSLRAIEKNLKEYRKIWIVGEKPVWIRNIQHIAYPDDLIHNADGNIARKILRVCQEEDLTEEFLFINDDHYIMKPTVAREIPPYHKGDLSKLPDTYFQQSFWRGRLFRTKNVLISKGLTALHFDCHVPMVMNKMRFPEVMSQFDFEKGIGYTMKSMYGNVVYGNSAPRLRGEKVTIFKKFSYEEVKRITKKAQFVAVNKDGTKAGFKQWINEQFPDPSAYEVEGSNNGAFNEVIRWLNGDKDFDKGSRLYEKYGKSRKIKKFLTKSPTMGRRMKLEHQMRELLNYI